MNAKTHSSDYENGWLVSTSEYCLFMAEKPDGIFADFKEGIIRCVEKKSGAFTSPYDKEILAVMLHAAKIQWHCKVWLIEPFTPMLVVKWHNGGELLKVLVGEQMGFVVSYDWLNIKRIEP